jgi:ankyrin repeat protein
MNWFRKKKKNSDALLIEGVDTLSLEKVKKAIKDGADVNIEYEFDQPLLFTVAGGEHTEIMKLLINAGADINIEAGGHNHGATPLFSAVWEGDTEAVRLLIDAKANVNAKQTSGATPLWWAAEHGHTEIVRLLIEAKADVNAARNGTAPGDDGVETPLLIASDRGHTEIVKLLCAAGADDSLQFTQKASTSTGHTTGIKYYLAHGLNLAPHAASKLHFEEARKQVAGLEMLSDSDDNVEAAKGEDYSILLYFRKSGGLYRATVSSDTTSGFLGMGTPQPEQIWKQLGYRLLEDSGDTAKWSNEEAEIIACYVGAGELLTEIHYFIPCQ